MRFAGALVLAAMLWAAVPGAAIAQAEPQLPQLPPLAPPPPPPPLPPPPPPPAAQDDGGQPDDEPRDRRRAPRSAPFIGFYNFDPMAPVPRMVDDPVLFFGNDDLWYAGEAPPDDAPGVAAAGGDR